MTKSGVLAAAVVFLALGLDRFSGPWVVAGGVAIGAEQDSSGLSGHQFTHSIPLRPRTLRTRSDHRLQSANPVRVRRTAEQAVKVQNR